jgi:hypothetical protein
MADDRESARRRLIEINAERDLARIARGSSMSRPPLVQTTNTCDACRHYLPLPAGHLPDDQELGHCGRWLLGYSIHMKKLPPHAIVTEDEDGWGALMGPKFGCVLWEPK